MPAPLTPDDIALVGRALYGSRWQTELAGDLGISLRNMRYWLAGERSPRDPDSVRARLRSLLARRAGQCRGMIERLESMSGCLA